MPRASTADAGSAVNVERLLDTALRICSIPSPTRDARGAADCLAELLRGDGFAVERPDANWPESPAVVTRLDSGRPGRTLQFTGHLDTVHLPFVPPQVEDGILSGSGTADMKGGLAAAVEALRALRDSGALTHGRVLFTTYDHHEGPWGDSRQLHALIDAGCLGDGALIPEYLCDRLPLAGRGLAIFQSRITREGRPVHEVFRPDGQPDVLEAGCELVRRLKALQPSLAERRHPLAGSGSVFVGRIQAGEIYNQSPSECMVDGTRRWLPGEDAAVAQAEFEAVAAQVARETGTQICPGYHVQRESFAIAEDEPLVRCFQQAYQDVTGGGPLPPGAKPFVDDGNTITGRTGIPAITHGPDARGAHTLEEWVPVSELVRVARVYAQTAVAFCST